MIHFLLLVLSSPAHAAEALPLIQVGDEAVVQASHSRRHDLGGARSQGLQRLSDLTLVEAGLTANYAAGGYWDILSLRGVPLDNRANYLREDLPISAETSIPLDNKQALEVTKGPVGMSTGAGTPAGMVNYKVKRPLAEDRVALTLGWSEVNQQYLGIDHNVVLSPRWASRSVIAVEKLAPPVENGAGGRGLLSSALDFRPSESALWQWEIEQSHQTSPSVAGFSLLGDRLPRVPNPRRNLNHQPWTQDVVFDALTSTLKHVRLLPGDLTLTASLGIQLLETDDRLAYPYGCGKEDRYDRFCSDGTFDLYDYRSENEKRLTTSGRVALELPLGAHQLTTGAVWAQRRERFGRQAFNYVGEGRIDQRRPLPAAPELTAENTNRDWDQVEVFVQDRLTLGAWQVHAKLSGQEIQRRSERTDGSEPQRQRERFVLPWFAVSHTGRVTSYLSYSEGSEFYVTPNRPDYARAGRALPRATSRQWEAGVKTASFQLSVFQLTRPFLRDEAPSFGLGGSYDQRGVEATSEARWGRWDWRQSAMALALDAPAGAAVVNVPQLTWRSHVSFAATPQLRLTGSAIYEGTRDVLLDGSRQLDPWWRFDLGVQWREVTLRVSNVFGDRYWREAPRQYGHTYLYAGEVRRVGLTWETLF